MAIIALVAFATLSLSSFTGCSINPKADKVAVAAEIGTNTGWDVLDAFVHLEYAHRDKLEQYFGPGVHKAANEVRKYGRKATLDALDLIDVYEANRTPELCRYRRGSTTQQVVRAPWTQEMGL